MADLCLRAAPQLLMCFCLTQPAVGLGNHPAGAAHKLLPMGQQNMLRSGSGARWTRQQQTNVAEAERGCLSSIKTVDGVGMQWRIAA